jgi:zinc transporter, ZIP family
MVLLVALLTLLGLLGTERLFRRGREETSRLGTSYRLAPGIGLHNLGEGLAIGSAFALGETALGTFLVLGFALHNITEGVGIAAPVLKEKRPRLVHFVWLALLGGAPAILGTWIGGFAYSNLLSALFLAVGAGAILQAIFEVGRLLLKDSARAGTPALSVANLGGLTVRHSDHVRDGPTGGRVDPSLRQVRTSKPLLRSPVVGGGVPALPPP